MSGVGRSESARRTPFGGPSFVEAVPFIAAPFFSLCARKSLSSIFVFVSFPRVVLLGAVAGVGVEDVLAELISRARRRGVGWLKLF